MATGAAPVTIGRVDVPPGERTTIRVPIPRLYTHEEMSMTIQVIRGRREGAHMFLCSTLHGDELNGIEIIRRVVDKVPPDRLRGMLITAPIVNVFGLINHSRYLPDRRDLNRAFPGSLKGSLAARLAHLVMKEIVEHCTHGIDLHTGSNDRINLPQIRGDLDDEETRRCAEAFGARVMMQSSLRDGSLREAATKEGRHVLVYEAGEAMRFNHDAIEVGVRGVLNVVKALGMLTGKRSPRRRRSIEVESLGWVRARQSGFLHLNVSLGQFVSRRQVIASIQDPFGETRSVMRAQREGVVISHTKSPLVHRGDAVIHLAAPASQNDNDDSTE